MNLRAVESFYWVVMLRSVTRAAEKLHLTQSAMSSRIATLEQELGVPLLDRRDKQFRITPAGQRFFGHAERLLALQREILAEMGTPAIQPVLLKVGAFESASHSWLMDWVRGLHKAFDFMVPYVDPQKVWPYPQTNTPSRTDFLELLRRAAVAYAEPRYEALLQMYFGSSAGASVVQLTYPK